MYNVYLIFVLRWPSMAKIVQYSDKFHRISVTIRKCDTFGLVSTGQMVHGIKYRILNISHCNNTLR